MLSHGAPFNYEPVLSNFPGQLPSPICTPMCSVPIPKLSRSSRLPYGYQDSRKFKIRGRERYILIEFY